jgi:hypothetical protein
MDRPIEAVNRPCSATNRCSPISHKLPQSRYSALVAYSESLDARRRSREPKSPEGWVPVRYREV